MFGAARPMVEADMPPTRRRYASKWLTLVLCEADAHLRTSSIALLLGDAALLAAQTGAEPELLGSVPFRRGGNFVKMSSKYRQISAKFS